MQYYIFSPVTDNRQMGSYEQIKEFTTPLTKELIDHFGKLSSSRRDYLTDMPPLDKFKIGEESVVSDIISCKYISTNVGFIFSNKCKGIIDSSNIGEHLYHPQYHQF